MTIKDQGRDAIADEIDLLYQKQNGKASKELIEQWEPLIKRMLLIVCNFRSSDVCLDEDDLINFGRQLVNEALLLYDPARGAKFSTFVYRRLRSKFLNKARDFKARNRRGTLNITTLSSVHVMNALYADTTESDCELTYNPVTGLMARLEHTEETLMARLDAEAFLEQLDPIQQAVMIDYYVHGNSKRQIARRFSRSGRWLNQIFAQIELAARDFSAAGKINP